MTPKAPSPAEGARPSMGNFFQFLPGRPDSTSAKPDFESFLGNRETRKDDSEIQEEREAAKSRKKPIEAAAVAAPPVDQPDPRTDKPSSEAPERAEAPVPQQGTPENSKPENVSHPTKETNNEISEEPTSEPSEIAPLQKEVAPTASDPAENDIIEASENVESPSPEENSTEFPEQPSSPESKDSIEKVSDETEAPSPDANGMETAPLDPEMISLATFDGAESGPAIAVSREPSITSSNRLVAFANPDRNGLAPIAGSGNSAEAGLGHLASGQGTPQDFKPAISTTPSAQASSLFKALAPELDKFRQTGQNQMQLDIPVGDNESVRIRLSLRAGELRSTFITESPELREALQKAWPEFAQASRDRGVRLGDPSFQQSFQENSSTFGQNPRRERGTTDSDQPALAGYSAARKPASTRPTNQPSTALWA